MQLLNSQPLHLAPRLIVNPSPKLIFRYRLQAVSVHRGDSCQIITQRTQDFFDLVTKEKRVLRSMKLFLDGNSHEDAHSQTIENNQPCGIDVKRCIIWASAFSVAFPVQQAQADVAGAVYDVAAIFELSIQLSYLLMLLALIGVGTFFVIRQVLTRRELDLSAKELQEQVRSGDANATEYFELGAVMLRRKIYPAATKYFLQAIDKWDGDDQDLSQVYNALGVSYVRDEKLDKAVVEFEAAVKLQPGYVTAWNNLGDAYEKKKEYVSALKAFDEALLFDPNNTVARPRRDALKDRVDMYKGVPVKPSKK